MMIWPWWSPSSSVESPPYRHYFSYSFILSSLSPTRSDIYLHEDVMDFTNPFLAYEEGYTHPLAKVMPTTRAQLIPISPIPAPVGVPLEEEEEELFLPKEPLTRRGYPRGQSQGDSSGWCPLLLWLRSNG